PGRVGVGGHPVAAGARERTGGRQAGGRGQSGGDRGGGRGRGPARGHRSGAAAPFRHRVTDPGDGGGPHRRTGPLGRRRAGRGGRRRSSFLIAAGGGRVRAATATPGRPPAAAQAAARPARGATTVPVAPAPVPVAHWRPGPPARGRRILSPG